MNDCVSCLYYERCDVVFDGVLSNIDNKPCDQYINKSEYEAKILNEAAMLILSKTETMIEKLLLEVDEDKRDILTFIKNEVIEKLKRNPKADFYIRP